MKKIRANFKSLMRKSLLLLMVIILSGKLYSQSWSDVGGGLCEWAFASVVYNGELIVGGQFTCAGGVPANNIARWDGTQWLPLGAGVNGKVWALTVYNGKLIVGGQFTQAGSTPVLFLAKWNGTAWSDVNGDMGSIVSALTVYNNELIVGGYFTDADGFPANYIVGWNNSAGWFNLGSGMGGGQGQVMALNVYNNELIATGFFTTAGGNPANHIAKWDGSSWSTLGSGLSSIGYSLGKYNGDLIAGGLFSSAGGVAASSIAKWNGTSWAPLGSGIGPVPSGDRYVFSLSGYNGSLFAGGWFATAGGLTANSIAKWDGTTWSDLQGGVQYGGANAFTVQALSVYNNDLYACGIFTSAGSVGVAHIASWHESPVGISENNFGNDQLNLQNDPNPFEMSTSVKFHLPHNGNTKLVLYDVAGRVVKILFDEFKQQGNYSIEISGDKLSPGLYFLNLKSGSKQVQIKFVKK